MPLPIHLKLKATTWDWPADCRSFYLVTASGVHLCRQTELFRSIVPAQRMPDHLDWQAPMLDLRYPPLPGALIERAVGFFDRVARADGAEAQLLLTHDVDAGYDLICPPQVSYVETSCPHRPLPLRLTYEVPPLPAGARVVGSIHSHVYHEAFTSDIDARDAGPSGAGLHLVVGRLQREPPDLHGSFSADGHLFDVGDPWALIDGYRRRNDDEVPLDWVDAVKVVRLNLPWKWPGKKRTSDGRPHGSGREMAS